LPATDLTIDPDDDLSRDKKENSSVKKLLRKVHPHHFISNKAISRTYCLARCHFLKLSNVEQIVDIAYKEVKDDQHDCLHLCKWVLNRIIRKEAEFYRIRWAGGKMKVLSTAHLGKALADATTVDEALPIWTVDYQIFKDMDQAKLCKRTAITCMKEIGVTYDTAALQQNSGHHTCFELCMSEVINAVHKQLQSFGKCSQYRISLLKEGPYIYEGPPDEDDDNEDDDNEDNPVSQFFSKPDLTTTLLID
jgi:hypothetical protein